MRIDKQLIMENRFRAVFSWLCIASLSSCGATPANVSVTLGSNDVSILFPLPANYSQASNLLALAEMGQGGPLLSERLFQQISQFASNSAERGAYAAWRIVAARIDPCFPDLALLQSAPSQCRRQLRLVSQSISGHGDNDNPPPDTLFADDATIHLFYEFNEAEFTALAKEFVGLRSAATADANLALGPHPLLSSQGVNGSAYQALVAIIKKYAGDARLVQLTAMDGRSVAWEFAGYSRVGSALQPMSIHGLPTTQARQTLSSDSGGIFESSPATTEFRQLDALVGTLVGGGVGDQTAKLTASKSDIDAALKVTLTVDDPTSAFNPNNLDCATCHVAGRARARAATLGFASDSLPRFENVRNLEITTPAALAASPQSQRAFGYRNRDAIINQRVVNESAAVADALEVLLSLDTK
jgi:hypothetical protein